MIGRVIAVTAGALLRLLLRLQPVRFRDRFGHGVLDESLEEIGTAVSGGVRPTLVTSTRLVTDDARAVAFATIATLGSAVLASFAVAQATDPLDVLRVSRCSVFVQRLDRVDVRRAMDQRVEAIRT